MATRHKRVFTKHPANPILRASDLSEGIIYVLNPGAIKYNDEYILMLDAVTLEIPIVFWLARSLDGVNFTPDSEPISWPRWSNDIEETCVYDPRITYIEGEYIIMYASQQLNRGVRTGVVRTTDFVKFERIEQEEVTFNNRNSVLFPERINGSYVRFDRPMSENQWASSSMCLSYSEDLIHWSDTKVLMEPRAGFWDSHKIGAGAVPLKTPHGWLEVYHGVEHTCNGFIYRLGVMLLDLEDPSKIIARGHDAVLWPEHDYELMGRVPNVTFSCNALVEDDGIVKIYYGAADTCIGLAEAKLTDLLEVCYTKNQYLEDFFENSKSKSS